MNRRKYLPLPFLLLLFYIGATDVCAQRVEYCYDDAGNRTVRKEITLETRSNAGDADESLYEDALAEMQIRIYPNPTKGMLRVDISGMEDLTGARIALYNLSGALLQQYTEVASSNVIDMSSRPAGVYVMRITYGECITNWKIIKE
ncbi:MAG: T9SS type A sorting domain-containing protein [Prevotellaceae bacterium]|jgi:hypothetical protein|nr:T9SS type A sorting domain-containing protein [Prevotellaceae bacterium]